MKVNETNGAELDWITHDANGKKWFSCKLNLIDFKIEKTTDEDKAQFIQSLIRSSVQLNSDFLSKWKKYKVVSQLEFDPEWGFGSSSTLITNLANWAELSPFELFFETQNGSGYDVATAMAEEAVLYQKDEKELSFEQFEWSNELLKSIYVYYQGHKQNSEEAVKSWSANKNWKSGDVDRISKISEELADCDKVDIAIELFREHDQILSRILSQPALQEEYPDYKGVIKPLGAWGGDFAMAMHPDTGYTENYLKDKGIETYFLLKDIVLK